jgi:hypothetical protein
MKPTPTDVPSRARATLIELGRYPAMFARWVREGYPEWSPRPGHTALIALCGQPGLLLDEDPESIA